MDVAFLLQAWRLFATTSSIVILDNESVRVGRPLTILKSPSQETMIQRFEQHTCIKRLSNTTAP
jgi:hypothetical protein